MTIKYQGPFSSCAIPLVLCLGLFAAIYFYAGRYITISDTDACLGNIAWKVAHEIPTLLHAYARDRWTRPSLPLNYMDWHGPGEIYIAMPFLLFFGRTPAAIYWRNGFFAFFGLGMTYGLSWALYQDGWSAFLATLLLASSPCFVMFSHIGIFTGAAVVAFETACLFFLLGYAQRREPWLAYLGLGCAGLGLATRDAMAAPMLGLIAYMFLNHRRVLALVPREPSLRKQFVLIGLCSFLVSLIPFAVDFLLYRKEFLSRWGGHLLLQKSGRSNLDYVHNLSIRIRQLKDLLRGTASLDMFVENPDRFTHIIRGQWFLVLAILGAGIWSASLLASGRTMSKRWALPWFIIMVYLLVAPFTPSLLRPFHLLPLLPFIYLAACSSIALAGKTRLRAWIVAALLLFSSYRVWAGVLFMNALRAELRRTGGSEPKMFRAAIDLFQWFSRRPGRTPVIFGEWGEILAYYSEGKITPETVWPDPNHLSQTFQNEGDRLFQLNGACFVFDTFQENAAKHPFEAFLRETARRKLNVSLVDTIKGPRGEPVFLIYEVAQ